MYPGLWAEVLILILLLWLLVLSYIIYRERRFLRELFPKSESRDIRNKFLEVIRNLEETRKENILLHKNIRDLAREVLGHVQRVEVLRYNPYGDTGGDQSFSVALLDGRGNGLVLTSLHTRAGTRVYIKEIKKGQSILELSKEEKEVVKKALL